MKARRRGQARELANALNRLTDFLITAEGKVNKASSPETGTQTDEGKAGKITSAHLLGNGLKPEFIEKYGLSKRQAEVTEALIKGKSNKEIGSLLGIELNTVQVHIRKIYRKTGAKGRYALMVLITNEQ